MKEAGARLNDGGHIVVISSSSVVDPVPGMCVYSSSKAAIQLMATIAAQEFLDAMIEKTALKRLAQPRDIANVVAFLASDESAYMTGQVTLVDGGVF